MKKSLALAAALALPLTACSLGSSSLKPEDVETLVANELAAVVGAGVVPIIDCGDDGIPAEVGHEFTCTLSVAGDDTELPVTVVIESIEGNTVSLDIKVADAPAAAPEPAETTEPAPEPQASGDVTAPGTTLAIGESAVIEYPEVVFPEDGGDAYPSENVQLVRVAITSVSPASAADLPDDYVFTGVTEDQLAVSKITYEVQQAGPAVLDMSRRGMISNIDFEGFNSYSVFGEDSIPGCPHPTFLGEEFQAGGVFEGCFLAVYVKPNPMPNIELGIWLTDTYDSPIVWVP